MNFYQIYTRVQSLINDDSTNTLARIKETINFKVNEILQQGFWRFASRTYTLTTVSGTTDYYLPSDLDRIIDIKQTDTPTQLRRMFIENFDKLRPNPTQVGKPLRFMEMLEDSAYAQPTTTAKLVMLSTSASDVSPQVGATAVSIYGVSGGVDRMEVVNLSATNIVSSTLTYSKIYSVSPNLPPVGTLRFTEAVVGTEIMQLFPGEISRTYSKIKLDPIPDAAYELTVRYQARQIKLQNASDPIIIPDRYIDVLVNSVAADHLKAAGDDKANDYYTLAQGGLSRIQREQDMFYDITPSVQPETYGFYDYTNPFVR